jgi:DNA (cytosine-5)-methyltransferase 1
MTAHPPEPKLKVLSLFAGIGGFELGLERTGGFETVAQCEIDPFCRKVLAKHWPNVKRYEDVRTLTADTLRRDGIEVDVICGGFPCQDISLAGKGAGIEGERSGLWTEYARLIGELRPQFVFVENVAALLGRGLGAVLGDLAALGYDCWWDCIPASAVGAPHRRDRLWLVAYPGGAGLEGFGIRAQAFGARDDDAGCQSGGASIAPAIAHSISGQLAQCWPSRRMGREKPFSRDGDWPLTSEPFVCRGSHGVPDRAHRLRTLGNAVVPQIPELIGNAILEARRAA